MRKSYALTFWRITAPLPWCTRWKLRGWMLLPYITLLVVGYFMRPEWVYIVGLAVGVYLVLTIVSVRAALRRASVRLLADVRQRR